MQRQVTQFFQFGSIRVDATNRLIYKNGEQLALQPRVIETLLVLVRNANRIVDRESLLNAVWRDVAVEEGGLSRNISLLRKALGDEGRFIETLPKRGYRFTAEVKEECEDSPFHDLDEFETKFVLQRGVRLRLTHEESFENEPNNQSSTVPEETLVSRIPRPTLTTKSLNSANAWLVKLTRRPYQRLLAPAVALVLVLGVVGYFFSGVPSPNPPVREVAPIRSIAFLPPKSQTPERDNAAIRLGIADSLSKRFGALRKLEVRSTSAISPFLTTDDNPIDVGHKLAVDAVMAGNLEQEGGRLRVTLRILDVRNSSQIWSATFDEAERDLFQLQTKVALQLAAALSMKLTPAEQQLLVKDPTVSREAYIEYLKGNYLWNKRGESSLKSVPYFERAIELDPTFAEAYVGLANAYAMSINRVPAQILVEKALELNSGLAEAHATHGFIRMFHHWDWQGAEAALDRAIQLNPNSANAHHWKGVYYSLLGRLDEAKREMHRALELDPLSLIITADIGQLHYFAREYDMAIEYCNRALALDGSFQMALEYLAIIYSMKGMSQESFDLLTRLHDATTAERYQRAYRRAGRAGICEIDLRTMQNSRLYKEIDKSVRLAQIKLCLGDPEGALGFLELAYRDRLFMLAFVNVDPIYDPLRSHPRFQHLIRQMGFVNQS